MGLMMQTKRGGGRQPKSEMLNHVGGARFLFAWSLLRMVNKSTTGCQRLLCCCRTQIQFQALLIMRSKIGFLIKSRSGFKGFSSPLGLEQRRLDFWHDDDDDGSIQIGSDPIYDISLWCSDICIFRQLFLDRINYTLLLWG